MLACPLPCALSGATSAVGGRAPVAPSSSLPRFRQAGPRSPPARPDVLAPADGAAGSAIATGEWLSRALARSRAKTARSFARARSVFSRLTQPPPFVGGRGLLPRGSTFHVFRPSASTAGARRCRARPPRDVVVAEPSSRRVPSIGCALK